MTDMFYRGVGPHDVWDKNTTLVLQLTRLSA